MTALELAKYSTVGSVPDLTFMILFSSPLCLEPCQMDPKHAFSTATRLTELGLWNHATGFPLLVVDIHLIISPSATPPYIYRILVSHPKSETRQRIHLLLRV